MVLKEGVSNSFFFLFWICKGDLKKNYYGKMEPIQSFLFCIKSTKRSVAIHFLLNDSGALFIKRNYYEYVAIYFHNMSLFGLIVE